MDSSTDITARLVAWSSGDATALDEIYPLIHTELRRLAKNYLFQFTPGNIFETGVLINEAFIKLIDQKRVVWQNRAHFFAIAAKVMRRVLLNHIRDARRVKRGGGAPHLTLTSGAAQQVFRIEEVLDLDTALTRLSGIDPVKAEIVEMKFFGGMNNEEIAEVLGISRASVVRYWRFAKAWLLRDMDHE